MMKNKLPLVGVFLAGSAFAGPLPEECKDVLPSKKTEYTLSASAEVCTLMRDYGIQLKDETAEQDAKLILKTEAGEKILIDLAVADGPGGYITFSQSGSYRGDFWFVSDTSMDGGMRRTTFNGLEIIIEEFAGVRHDTAR